MAEGWTYVLCHQDFRFELKAGEQTVGRSRTSDVAVNDPSVSRKHVIVRPKDGLVLLTDLGSSNGTFINGKKVQGEAILENGDVLRLGDAELRVEIASSAPQPAASGAGEPDSMQTVRLPAGGPRPQPGEATFFLAAESMKLAEALEAAQAAQGPEPGSHLAGPLATQRLPASALPGLGAAPAASPLGTQRIDFSQQPLPAAPAASPLGTQRIDFSQQPLPAAPAPPEAPAPAGAQTVRLSAAEMRQLESPPASAFDAEPISFEPISFDPGPLPPGAAQTYPSFEQPPAFEPWAPAAAENSFAGIADPSSPSIDRPPAPAPPAPPPYRPTETKFVEPEPPTPSFPPPPAVPPVPMPSSAPPAPPLVPAFAPPAPPVPPPSFAPPAPPAPPPSFAPPAPPVPAFAPPASFDRPMPPAAPPPPAADPSLRGLRQPSSAGELLPSLDDLDAAIGTPGIQDPLQQRSGTAQVPVGVPWGEPCAGFGIRLLAYLLDALWIAAVQTAAIIFSDSDPIFTSAASLVTLAVIFFGWSIWGTTPGKRVVGLYLHGEDGQTGIGFLRAFIRMVGYFVSGLFFGIGFLMIAFTKDHRGLHDRIARTWVYRHSS